VPSSAHGDDEGGRDVNAVRASGRIARTAGRLLVVGILFVLYALGWLAGGIVVMCTGSAAAVRLGWSDVRKAGTHGDA